MMKEVFKAYQTDIEDVTEWCNTTYNELFAPQFEIVRNYATRLESNVAVITDDELVKIITELPAQLFVAAESLNNLRLQYEITKLKNKQTRSVAPDTDMCDFDIVAVAYSKVIQRVENEMTYAKELIMGAKKVFDSRKSAEHSNPIAETLPDDYDKVYIK